MSQPNTNSLGVVEPSPVIARRKVNENLLKIKQEIQDAQDDSDNSDLEPDYDYSQPIRPQQFSLISIQSWMLSIERHTPETY